MRIVIAGSGRLGVSVMEPLLQSPHTVVGILQNGNRYTPLQRRTQILRARLFAIEETPLCLATQHRIPIQWLTNQNEDELDQLRALKPDILISCGFSIIFSESLLSIPRIGCINVHSSLLPKHRGPSPFAHVILQGDTESGITYHVTEAKIDTGPIVAQYPFPVGERDTGLSVYYTSCDTARDTVLDVVDRIDRDGLVAAPQDESLATYDPRVTEEFTKIDWTRPAPDLHRLVRAAIAYHPAWFIHRGRVVRITQAHVQPGDSAATPGTILAVQPCPVIATGSGALALQAAYVTSPRTTPWPTALTRLKPGNRLD
jgi:methionyl-tRNA formyltransferase